EIMSLIEAGYCYFGTGGALGFDTLAATAVLELKQAYPHIKLILVLPCLEQAIGWTEQSIATYEEIKNRCDKCTYTSKHYDSSCMQKRNRHLVDHSSVCIAFLTKNSGGTAFTVDYAEKQKVRVVNIAN
ncbi:MAG: SLOG family protein, partial [Clostridia bacterium]